MRQTVVALSMLLAAITASAQSFTLKGTVPGVRKGTKVEIISAESGRDSITATLSGDGTFKLKGTLEAITMAELLILDRPESELKKDVYPTMRGIKIMLEPGVDYTVSAPAFDKIPLFYDLYAETYRLEHNVTVNGGKAQSHYNEWRQLVRDAEVDLKEANFKTREAKYGIRKGRDAQPASAEVIEQAEQDEARKQAVHDSLNAVFLTRHPDYAVSLYLKQKAIDKAFFRYTAAELDEMKARYSANEDKMRYERFCTEIENLRKYLKNTPYTDFEAALPDSTRKAVSSFMPTGTYTLIDFWASWCGPCRAAIPHVRTLHKQYAGKLNVLSVSVDQKETAWRKAMNEEKMEWTQLWLPSDLARTVKATYQVNVIPYMLVINPQGQIIYAGHNPSKVSKTLEEANMQ